MTRISQLLSAPIGDAGEGAISAPAISLEYFPPKTTKATAALKQEIATLDQLDPSYVSVTYGAGGSTRNNTADLVRGLAATKPYPVMPHMTAIGHTREEISELLTTYAAAGVHNVLSLAGDPPSDPKPATGVASQVGDFRHATDLIAAIVADFDFGIGVAAFPETHPRSSSRKLDRLHLAYKLERADFAITQFFFDVDDYSRLVAEMAAIGCYKPIVAGVIPVTNPTSVRRFADMNGAKVDEAFFGRLEGAKSEADQLEIAIDYSATMVDALVDLGAPGIHFYTLNRAEPTMRIVERCKLGRGLRVS